MKQVCEAFMALCELGEVMNVPPLNQHDGCWELDVDDHWFVAVNGHKKPRLMRKHPNLPPIDPFTAYVEWNGWPAGVFRPDGGAIAAGSLANEQTFVAALRARAALDKTEEQQP